MKKNNIFTLLSILTVFLCRLSVQAEVYKGIEFPNGELSFADEVIQYNPLYSGDYAPTNPLFIDPQDALGIPDFPDGGGTSDEGAVSLGGGLIELRFVDNYLVNNGHSGHDLYVFEVGPAVEDTFVAIRPTVETANILDPNLYDANGDGYYEIGKVYGSISSIDIDSFFPGYDPNTLLFDAVQLIDDINEGSNTTATAGADIDAVGAIGSIRSCDYSILGDFNRDCKINLKDLVIIASNWLLDCKQTPNDPSCIPLP